MTRTQQRSAIGMAAALSMLQGCGAASSSGGNPDTGGPLSGQGGYAGVSGSSFGGSSGLGNAGLGNTGNAGGFGNTGNAGGLGNTGNAAGIGNTGNAGGFGNTGNAAGVGNTGNAGGFGNTGNTAGAGNTAGVPPAGGSPNVGGGGGGPIPDGGGIVGPINPGAACGGETLPPITDYTAMGPFPSTVVNNTGSDGNYTIYRPTTLGANGFKHPVATWGNGITTTPAYYPGLLGTIASHGFVIIASNSTSVTADLMTSGLDWMVAQNGVAGDYQGKLNTTCLVTIGYSLGGGAAVDAGSHANVVATASMHGVTGASNALHGPLLLLTAQTDTFVVPATFVTPTFNASDVQTFYGTLSSAADTSNEGHLIPVDGALSLITSNSANLDERAAMVAWLRLWVYGDQGAKAYFYGDDCVLCKDPWTMPQRKNWN